MDTRKYLIAGSYLKAADVVDGTIKQIINVQENDRYGKLDLWFLDGSRLGLSNQKNLGELHRAYGTDSDSWLGKNVRLTVKPYVDNNGNPGKTIELTAVDPEIPLDQRPKLTTLSPPQEKPAPKPKNGGKHDDMDDKIPW